MLTYSLV